MPKKGDYIDITGKIFGKLTVIQLSEHIDRKYYWECKCECGNITIVEGSKLKNGHTKSCGCIKKERISKVNYKNGLSKTKIAFTYRNMLNRCYRESNEMYYLYGARGITVCDEWLGENGFVNFCNWSMQNGYKKDLTIDRIDNKKGYSPDNCRWVDIYVQANNKTNNIFLKINGVIDTVGNHARRYNVSYWNLLHYAKGGRNTMYPELQIEAIDEYKEN